MKRKIFNPLLLLMVMGTIWGCYPGGPDSVNQYDLEYTNYDADYVFTGQPKYAMPTQIVLIDGTAPDPGNPSNDDFVNQIYATQINAVIQSNMKSLGYTLVTDTADADFLLLTGAIEATNIAISDWGGYYGWGYWGYYYPYYSVTSYTTGTLMLTLVSRKSDFENISGKSRAVWLGIANGVLTGSTSNAIQRVTTSVNQLYSQSPYLHQ